MAPSASPQRSVSPPPQNDQNDEERVVPEKLKGKQHDHPTDTTQDDDQDESESEGENKNESGDKDDDPPDEPQTGAAPDGGVPSAGDWQAIWSPAHNAYYFYNPKTNETTWTNPLQTPSASSDAPVPSTSTAAESSADPKSTTPAALASMYQLQEAAVAQGIDPSLAYLDPSLVAGPSSSGTGLEYTAKFNARTGAFAKTDARDPSHLSEYERAKRMSQFYFDVNAWEKEVAEQKEQEEAEGKKRKRPSKKDLERFKEQKRQKKIAKTAWLRT